MTDPIRFDGAQDKFLRTVFVVLCQKLNFCSFEGNIDLDYMWLVLNFFYVFFFFIIPYLHYNEQQ